MTYIYYAIMKNLMYAHKVAVAECHERGSVDKTREKDC